jgi:3-deoxy-D-manno-octulosonic acid (KDO) 8-phosphate synthase
MSLILDGFYDAKTARDIATGGAAAATVVLTEINALQIAVNSAAAGGALEILVVNSTTMTQGAVYYEAWNDPQTYNSDAHNMARARMDKVINYFTRIGYSIKREREGVANRIQWKIKW